MSSRSGVNRYAKKRLVDKYVKPEATKPQPAPTQQPTRSPRAGPRGQQPPQQQPPQPPQQPPQQQPQIVDLPEDEVKRSQTLPFGLGEEIPEDRLGVDEETDEYKKGVAGFARGLGAPTSQIAQIPLDIAAGVKAEDQTMAPSWIDLAIIPALGPMAASGELGITTDKWYSPIRSDWFDHPSVPEFMRPDPTEKRDFWEGMSNNLTNLGAVLTSPQYYHTARWGHEGMGLAGYEQTGKEFQQYPEYYIGSMIGEIPYFVVSPMLAAKTSAKVTATAVRIAGKPFASVAYVNASNKLQKATLNLNKAVVTEKKALDTITSTTPTRNIPSIDTKPVKQAFNALESHSEIEVQLRKKNISELKKEIRSAELDEDKAVLQQMINENEISINTRKIEVDDMKTKYKDSLQNLTDKKKEFDTLSKSGTTGRKIDLAYSDYTAARKEHLFVLRDQIARRFDSASTIADQKIKREYNVRRDNRMWKLQTEISKMERRLDGYQTDGTPKLSKFYEADLARKRDALSQLKTKTADDIEFQKAEKKAWESLWGTAYAEPQTPGTVAFTSKSQLFPNVQLDLAQFQRPVTKARKTDEIVIGYGQKSGDLGKFSWTDAEPYKVTRKSITESTDRTISKQKDQISILEDEVKSIERLERLAPITGQKDIPPAIIGQKARAKYKAKIEKKKRELERIDNEQPDISTFEKVATKIEEAPDNFNRSVKSKFTKKWKIQDQEYDEQGRPIKYKDGIAIIDEKSEALSTLGKIANVYSQAKYKVKKRYNREVSDLLELGKDKIRMLNFQMIQDASNPSVGTAIRLSKRDQPELYNLFWTKMSDLEKVNLDIRNARQWGIEVSEDVLVQKSRLNNELNELMTRSGMDTVEFNPTTVIAEKTPVQTIRGDFSPGVQRQVMTQFKEIGEKQQDPIKLSGWVEEGQVPKFIREKYNLKEATLENISKAMKETKDERLKNEYQYVIEQGITKTKKWDTSKKDWVLTDEGKANEIVTHEKLNIIESDTVLVFDDPNTYVEANTHKFVNEVNAQRMASSDPALRGSKMIEIRTVERGESSVEINQFIMKDKPENLLIVGSKPGTDNLSDLANKITDADVELAVLKKRASEHRIHETETYMDMKKEWLKVVPDDVKGADRVLKWAELQTESSLRSVLDDGKTMAIGQRTFSGKNPSGMNQDEFNSLVNEIASRESSIQTMENKLAKLTSPIKQLERKEQGSWVWKVGRWAELESKKKGGGPIKLEPAQQFFSERDWSQVRFVDPAKPDAGSAVMTKKGEIEFQFGYKQLEELGIDPPEFYSGVITKKHPKEIADSKAGLGPSAVWSKKDTKGIQNWVWNFYLPVDPLTLAQGRGRSSKYGSSLYSLTRSGPVVRGEPTLDLARLVGLIGPGRGGMTPVLETRGVKKQWRTWGRSKKTGKSRWRREEKVQYGPKLVEGQPVYPMADLTKDFGPSVKDAFERWRKNPKDKKAGDYPVELPDGIGTTTVRELYENQIVFMTQGKGLDRLGTQVDNRITFLTKQLEDLKAENQNITELDKTLDRTMNNRINAEEAAGRNLAEEMRQTKKTQDQLSAEKIAIDERLRIIQKTGQDPNAMTAEGQKSTVINIDGLIFSLKQESSSLEKRLLSMASKQEMLKKDLAKNKERIALEKKNMLNLKRGFTSEKFTTKSGKYEVLDYSIRDPEVDSLFREHLEKRATWNDRIIMLRELKQQYDDAATQAKTRKEEIKLDAKTMQTIEEALSGDRQHTIDTMNKIRNRVQYDVDSTGKIKSGKFDTGEIWDLFGRPRPHVTMDEYNEFVRVDKKIDGLLQRGEYSPNQLDTASIDDELAFIDRRLGELGNLNEKVQKGNRFRYDLIESYGEYKRQLEQRRAVNEKALTSDDEIFLAENEVKQWEARVKAVNNELKSLDKPYSDDRYKKLQSLRRLHARKEKRIKDREDTEFSKMFKSRKQREERSTLNEYKMKEMEYEISSLSDDKKALNVLQENYDKRLEGIKQAGGTVGIPRGTLFQVSTKALQLEGTSPDQFPLYWELEDGRILTQGRSMSAKDADLYSDLLKRADQKMLPGEREKAWLRAERFRKGAESKNPRFFVFKNIDDYNYKTNNLSADSRPDFPDDVQVLTYDEVRKINFGTETEKVMSYFRKKATGKEVGLQDAKDSRPEVITTIGEITMDAKRIISNRLTTTSRGIGGLRKLLQRKGVNAKPVYDLSDRPNQYNLSSGKYGRQNRLASQGITGAWSQGRRMEISRMLGTRDDLDLIGEIRAGTNYMVIYDMPTVIPSNKIRGNAILETLESEGNWDTGVRVIQEPDGSTRVATNWEIYDDMTRNMTQTQRDYFTRNLVKQYVVNVKRYVGQESSQEISRIMRSTEYLNPLGSRQRKQAKADNAFLMMLEDLSFDKTGQNRFRWSKSIERIRSKRQHDVDLSAELGQQIDSGAVMKWDNEAIRGYPKEFNAGPGFKYGFVDIGEAYQMIYPKITPKQRMRKFVIQLGKMNQPREQLSDSYNNPAEFKVAKKTRAQILIQAIEEGKITEDMLTPADKKMINEGVVGLTPFEKKTYEILDAEHQALVDRDNASASQRSKVRNWEENAIDELIENEILVVLDKKRAITKKESTWKRNKDGERVKVDETKTFYEPELLSTEEVTEAVKDRLKIKDTSLNYELYSTVDTGAVDFSSINPRGVGPNQRLKKRIDSLTTLDVERILLRMRKRDTSTGRPNASRVKDTKSIEELKVKIKAKEEEIKEVFPKTGEHSEDFINKYKVIKQKFEKDFDNDPVKATQDRDNALLKLEEEGEYRGIEEVYSGVQKGVDQDGLREAREAGVKTGGWAPRGYITKDDKTGKVKYGKRDVKHEALLKKKASGKKLTDVEEEQLKKYEKQQAINDKLVDDLAKQESKYGDDLDAIDALARRSEIGWSFDNGTRAEQMLFTKIGGYKGLDEYNKWKNEADMAKRIGGADWTVKSDGEARAKEFGLREDTSVSEKASESEKYRSRTKLNVRDTDGTVYFGKVDSFGNPTSPGGKLNKSATTAEGKPFIVNPTESELAEWAIKHQIRKLNVAGSREGDPRVKVLKGAIQKTQSAKQHDIFKESMYELNTRLQGNALKNTKDIQGFKPKKTKESKYKSYDDDGSGIDDLLNDIGVDADVGPDELKSWFKDYVRTEHPDAFRKREGRDMTKGEMNDFINKKNAYEELMSNKGKFFNQFKARKERVRKEAEERTPFDFSKFQDLQDDILERRDRVASKAKLFDELDDMKSELNTLAKEEWWVGDPKKSYNSKPMGRMGEDRGVAAVKTQYKKLKLGKKLDMTTGFFEGNTALGRMGVDGLGDEAVRKIKKRDFKTDEQLEEQFIPDYNIDKTQVNTGNGVVDVSYKITPAGIEYNPDDLIEVARKRTWESSQRNLSLRDMKQAEKFVSEQIQKETIEGIGFSEGAGRVAKKRQNEAFKYLSVQEDGSYSFMSQMGYPDDVTVGTNVASDSKWQRNKRLDFTVQTENYIQKGVPRKSTDVIREEQMDMLKEEYPYAFDEFLDTQQRETMHQKVSIYERQIKDKKAELNVVKQRFTGPGASKKLTDPDYNKNSAEYTKIQEQIQIMENEKSALDQKLLQDDNRRTQANTRQVKAFNTERIESEPNMYDRGIYGVLQGSVLSSAFAQSANAEEYDVNNPKYVQPQVTKDIWTLSSDVITPAKNKVIGGIKASAFELETNVRQAISPVTAQSIFEQDAQAQRNILAGGLDQLTFGQLREGLVKPTFRFTEAYVQKDGILPKLDPFLQARKVNYSQQPMMAKPAPVLGRIQPMAPYFPPNIYTQYTPPKRRYKRDRWKKKKTYWEVPEYWFQPGYWGGKDQLGPGYRVFSGAEPKSIRKKERRKNLDGTLPRFNLR